jgi:hypothetical protein
MKIFWVNVLLLFVICSLLAGCLQNAPSTSAASTSAESAKHSENSTPILLPVKVSGKWGYVNGNGQLVINLQFDGASEFHEGRAAVCLGKPCFPERWMSSSGDHWGYIDSSGKMVITPQYGAASDFSEGLASVCTGDCSSDSPKPSSQGYINRDGEIVIPLQFGIAGDFSEGLAQVCIGTCKWKMDSGYSGKFGFIDHSGHLVINPQYDRVDDFKNGFAKVTLLVEKGKEAKRGYIDKTGKTIWQPSN